MRPRPRRPAPELLLVQRHHRVRHGCQATGAAASFGLLALVTPEFGHAACLFSLPPPFRPPESRRKTENPQATLPHSKGSGSKRLPVPLAISPRPARVSA